MLAPLGALISEPVGGRSALLLGGAPAVAALRFAGSVAVAGEERLLDGVNRRPGLVPACGGRGGDRPTERPDAATTCTDPSELVAYTPEWGAAVPRIGRRVSVRGGVVVPRWRRSACRRDGSVLAGTGDAAALPAPARPRPARRLRSTSACAARRRRSTAGGDRGRWPAAARPRPRSRARRRGGLRAVVGPGFYGTFVAARQPRTLAGVRADGRLILVTVDGRRPGWSAGVTLAEAARLMRSLGARDALNLDGGGSSAMTVRGRVVSRPSDAGGERPVSDALVVLP